MTSSPSNIPETAVNVSPRSLSQYPNDVRQKDPGILSGKMSQDTIQKQGMRVLLKALTCGTDNEAGQ